VSKDFYQNYSNWRNNSSEKHILQTKIENSSNKNNLFSISDSAGKNSDDKSVRFSPTPSLKNFSEKSLETSKTKVSNKKNGLAKSSLQNRPKIEINKYQGGDEKIKSITYTGLGSGPGERLKKDINNYENTVDTANFQVPKEMPGINVNSGEHIKKMDNILKNLIDPRIISNNKPPEQSKSKINLNSTPKKDDASRIRQGQHSSSSKKVGNEKVKTLRNIIYLSSQKKEDKMNNSVISLSSNNDKTITDYSNCILKDNPTNNGNFTNLNNLNINSTYSPNLNNCPGKNIFISHKRERDLASNNVVNLTKNCRDIKPFKIDKSK
jgi:hypothetical protein